MAQQRSALRNGLLAGGGREESKSRRRRLIAETQQTVLKDRVALPTSVSVHIVHTAEQLDTLIEHLYKLSDHSVLHVHTPEAAVQQPVLGLDCEWQPGAHPVALLQLATRDAVYLVDVLCIRECNRMHAKLAELLSEVVFTSASLPKIGVGAAADMQKLMHDYPTLKLKGIDMRCVVDARSLVERCRPDLRRQARSSGLSALCEAVLSRHVSKEMQISNWAQRPLNTQQIEYAAIGMCTPVFHVTIRNHWFEYELYFCSSVPFLIHDLLALFLLQMHTALCSCGMLLFHTHRMLCQSSSNCRTKVAWGCLPRKMASVGAAFVHRSTKL